VLHVAEIKNSAIAMRNNSVGVSLYIYAASRLSEVTATIDYMRDYPQIEESASEGATYFRTRLGWVWFYPVCEHFGGHYESRAEANLGAVAHLLRCGG
jgi:hypothetical protein